MQIVPFIGETPINTSTFSIRVDPEDRRRVEQLTERASQIALVNDTDSFALAKHCAGQIKALLIEIDAARKESKRPQATMNNAIDELAERVAAPLATEQKRILAMLNEYVARQEAAEKAEARRREEALRAQVAEQQRKLKDAQEAQARAEAEARKAEDAASRMRAQAEAQRRQEAAEDAQLAQELALEASRIAEQVPPRGKVPGGRVDHPYEFALVNVEETVKAGCWRLLRWELNKMACADSVRAQREINPEAEPVLPGIKITQRVSVSVRATL